jgi:hypothetical protein
MPAGTVRAWVIGVLWAVLIPGLNQLLFFRYPAVTVGPLVAQLLSFPVGRAWASAVPRVKIFGVSLNPGPFTIKEHVRCCADGAWRCRRVLSRLTGGHHGHGRRGRWKRVRGGCCGTASTVKTLSRYRRTSSPCSECTTVCRRVVPAVALPCSPVLTGQTYSWFYQWLVVMSTQLIGFSIGGITRRFLVDPPSMSTRAPHVHSMRSHARISVWPANLVYCVLFNTLHAQHYAGIGSRGGVSRESFFTIAFVASALWYFIPGYLFSALSMFSWVRLWRGRTLAWLDIHSRSAGSNPTTVRTISHVFAGGC